MYEKEKKLVEEEFPGVKAVECFPYKNLLLVRVEHPSSAEANYDPFYSVDPTTGSVNEFSVLLDGDPASLVEAYEKHKNSS